MPNTEPGDIIWVTADSKLRGICNAVADVQQVGQTVLLIACFADTLAQLENALRARGIAYQRYTLLYLSTLCQLEPGMVVVALAQDFASGTDVAGDSRINPALSIIIAEHYPLPANERDLLQTLRVIPGIRQISFHSALTDPLLTRFGGTSVQKVAKQLGMSEETPISHPLISSALRQAQTKISRKVHMETSARSAEEWFQLNLPDGGK